MGGGITVGGMVSKAVPLLLNRRTKQYHGFINYDRLLAVVINYQ